MRLAGILALAAVALLVFGTSQPALAQTSGVVVGMIADAQGATVPGATITLISERSYRGSIYDIQRNSDWNSNSWVNAQNGDPKTVSKQQDWGYTLGGPIGKPGGDNRWFFFYSHEYRPRKTGGAINRFRVPSLLERQGDFSQSTEGE